MEHDEGEGAARLGFGQGRFHVSHASHRLAAISRMYETYYDGIVVQAAGATIAVRSVMSPAP